MRSLNPSWPGREIYFDNSPNFQNSKETLSKSRWRYFSTCHAHALGRAYSVQQDDPSKALCPLPSPVDVGVRAQEILT